MRSPVRPEDGRWHCTGASCRYADEAFPLVAGVPALVDFENSVLDADRLRAVEGASEVERSRLAGPLRHLLHPANKTAPANVARMLGLLRADAGSPAADRGSWSSAVAPLVTASRTCTPTRRST